MIKTFLLILSTLIIAPGVKNGQPFPALEGQTLEGKSIKLPEACKGKKTLIGMAYSQKAQDALMGWYGPVYDKFVAKVGMFDYQYDVNLYFVPMFIGLKQALCDATMKELKADNRKDLYPYILFYKGELEPFDAQLGMQDKTLPYFFVLDENGVIRYSTSGEFTEKKMEEIEAVLDK